MHFMNWKRYFPLGARISEYAIDLPKPFQIFTAGSIDQNPSNFTNDLKRI